MTDHRPQIRATWKPVAVRHFCWDIRDIKD
jgi:hypothetical protein